MYRVKQLPEFSRWLYGLLGDVVPVGNGVWEMREFFGPGWRMYYIQRDSTLIVMLGGGDKSTQKPILPRPFAYPSTFFWSNCHEYENKSSQFARQWLDARGT